VRSVKSADAETLDAWAVRKPGWVTRVREGRTWVFREGDPAVAELDAGVEPVQHVTRVTATPAGVQVVKARDAGTVAGYAATRAGFVARETGGHLWIFRARSPELATVDEGGELARHVTRLTATPFGVQVLKAPDADILEAWLASPAGFAARKVDGHLWVFRDGSPELSTVDGGRELVQHVTRVRATPSGVATVKAPDAGTLDAWERALDAEQPGRGSGAAAAVSAPASARRRATDQRAPVHVRLSTLRRRGSAGPPPEGGAGPAGLP
jgi:hypothetical protein